MRNLRIGEPPDSGFSPAGRPGMTVLDDALTCRNVHQFVAIEHALRVGEVEVAFPCGDDDGGDAIADQIAERAPCR